MTNQEKYLYHQVHPLKLFTDWSAGLLALYFFWKKHCLWQFFSQRFLHLLFPSFCCASLVWRAMHVHNRERFVKEHMTRTREVIRLLGYFIMSFGAWYHWLYVILLGFVVILLAWFT